MVMTDITLGSVDRPNMKDIKIDLLLWGRAGEKQVSWSAGEVYALPDNQNLACQKIMEWTANSDADYGLFWKTDENLPAKAVLKPLIMQKLDLAHKGLSSGMGDLWPDLAMIKQDWSMINAPVESASTSWRVSLMACLVRRSLIKDLGGIDSAYSSLEGASLDLGLRALSMGAIVEHRPELIPENVKQSSNEPPLHDLYAFTLRHFGLRWAQYLLVRRLLAYLQLKKELHAFQVAKASCKINAHPIFKPVNYHALDPKTKDLSKVTVSVIIPTLGRHKYIPDALNSLRQQTVHPFEVIVVDQNPIEERKPELYAGYEDLNLHVIWQDERGQSLARNTGISQARGKCVFLFDDDSIAQPDLIEQHLIPILEGYIDVSTGVAIPPSPEKYELPSSHRFPRVAQTFDTGNCLISLDLLKKMGGLDRNYDFGPGTDADLGTRLYLAGYRILHNPNAIRIHYKAPSGGLRTHGVHKYNTDSSAFTPFPPVTRSYYGLRFMGNKQFREMAFLSFVLSKFPKNIRNAGSVRSIVYGASRLLAGLLLYPIKRKRSLIKAQSLLRKGPQLSSFI